MSRFYYPGWKARADGSPAALTVGPSAPDGLLEVTAPPGARRLVLELEAGAAEKTGLRVSTASAFLWLGIFFVARGPRRAAEEAALWLRRRRAPAPVGRTA